MVLYIFATIFLVLVIRALVRRFQINREARQRGCKPPPTYPHLDPIFGLDFPIKKIYGFLVNKEPPLTLDRVPPHGKTYQINQMNGGIKVFTIDAENIAAMQGTPQGGLEQGLVFAVRPIRKVSEPFTGNGFLNTDGRVWSRYRSMLKPGFHKDNISDLDWFKETVQNDLMDYVPADGETFDLSKKLDDFFLIAASMFLFNRSLNDIPESNKSISGKDFLHAFHSAEQGIGPRILLGPLAPFILKQKEWLAHCRTVHQFSEDMVKAAMQDEKEKNVDEKKRNRSLIHNLLNQSDNVEEISPQLIHGMVATQETTSVLLSNALHLLSRHPDVYRDLRDQIWEQNEDYWDFETLRQQPLIHNIFFETLRLYPILANVNRVALKDTTLPRGGGPDGQSPIYIPKGTVVNNNFFGLHQDPQVFGPEPLKFRPERWNTIEPKQYEFMGFGGGLRQCLGKEKALAEAGWILVSIVRKAGPKGMIESRDSEEWAAKAHLTIRNKHGCKIAIVQE